MSTLTVKANRSSQFAESPSGTNLGAGQDAHLPVGYWSGYHYRAAVGFPTPAWPASGVINSATLKLRATGEVHVARGSSRDLEILRITGSWTANSATQDGGGSMSGAETDWPGPSTTTAGLKNATGPDTDDAWLTEDVTTIVRAMAPASMGGGGAAWLGFLLRPNVSGSTADTWECYSAKASSSDRPVLEVDYTTGGSAEPPPDAPTLIRPIGEGVSPAQFVAGFTITGGYPLIEGYEFELRDSDGILIWHPSA